MDFLDLTLPSPAENLALDEALLLEAESGRGNQVLRIWEWPKPAVVLGAGCVLVDDVDEAACTADGVPILRRSSGGGTVLLGNGCLCYSLVLSYGLASELTDVRSSYGYIHEKIREGLNGIVPGVELAGISDLAVGGRKFSGNAQQRKRTHLLHHGTILYEFDLSQVGRYLRVPQKQPDYRQRRAHDLFLVNLRSQKSDIAELLRSVWECDTRGSAIPSLCVSELVGSKYSKREWVIRR